MYNLALKVDEQKTHSQDFWPGLENYSKGSPAARDPNFVQRRNGQGRKAGPCCSSELILKSLLWRPLHPIIKGITSATHHGQCCGAGRARTGQAGDGKGEGRRRQVRVGAGRRKQVRLQAGGGRMAANRAGLGGAHPRSQAPPELCHPGW